MSDARSSLFLAVLLVIAGQVGIAGGALADIPLLTLTGIAGFLLAFLAVIAGVIAQARTASATREETRGDATRTAITSRRTERPADPVKRRHAS